MKLIKTSILSGLVAFVRLAAGFISTKIVAMYVGASGVAVIGAFANFVSIVLTFGNGAVGSGVVKYVAEYNDDSEKSERLIATSLKLSVYCSLIIGVVIIVFSGLVSDLLFTNSLYANPIRALGATLVFYSLNSIFISILNGKGEITIYTWVNTIGTVGGLILTCVLVYFYKATGALYALVLSQTLTFFLTLFLVLKKDWMRLSFFKRPLDIDILKDLGHYSAMAIVSACTIPVSQLWLRNMVIKEYGIYDAGIWQGLMKISDAYLMIITLALSTYYLPKLSSLSERESLRSEIFQGYKIIIPTILILSSLIFFSRDLIINILYTPDFIKMRDIFFWQLVGDFFKISSYLLAFLMLAKKKTKLYISSEVIFSVAYVFLSYLFTHKFGLEGITIAFALNYFLYFLFMTVVFRKLLFDYS